jgi:internalin A
VDSALELPELLSFTAEGYPFSDLTSLKGLVKLQHLMVISRKLRSLDGIESLGALVRLILSRCAHVEDLSPLSRHPSLTELELDTCEGITDLGPLAEVMNLRKLLIESSSGRVGSIEPLAELNDLEELYLIGVKVEDSNLRPLLNLRKLKKLGMAVWDGYVPTVGEVRTRLGIS